MHAWYARCFNPSAVSTSARLRLGLVVATLWVCVAARVEARGWLGAPNAKGHAAELLVDGQHSFDQRAKNIANADVILLKTYIFSDDDTGRATVKALADRARQGAKVYVQYDVKGTLGTIPKILGAALGKSYVPSHLQPLVDAGVTLIPTRVPTLKNAILGRDHDKLLVTWKKGEPARAILGGMNVGDVYSTSGPRFLRQKRNAKAHRDTDVEIQGPAVSTVINRFLGTAKASASRANFDSLVSHVGALGADEHAFVATGRHRDARVKIVYNTPSNGKNGEHIEAEYERLIRRTPRGETITMSSAYFLPSPRIQKAMAEATHRGVRFELFNNGKDSTDASARTVYPAGHSVLRSILKRSAPGSIVVREFTGNDLRNQGSIHQKVASFGKTGPVVVGSANLDTLSAKVNGETIAVVHDARVRRVYDAAMRRDLKHSRDVTHEIRSAPIGKRAMQWLYRKTLGRIL